MKSKIDTYWNDKEVIVTGAGGFIGSHLVEKLLKCGARTIALIHYNSSNNWGHLEKYKDSKYDNLKVTMGDIRDIYYIKNIICDAQYIFHLAALIGIPYSYKSPNEYISTNIQGTANLLQSVNINKLKKFIGTSTSEVYGTALYTPIDEKHPLQGQSPYSATKIGADMMVQSYSKSYDIPSIILRPFNTYGPRQSARAIIPTIISQALKSNNIKVGNLNTYRDFNYVNDTVNAFLELGKSDYKESEIFNCASGNCIDIKSLILKIGTLLEKKLVVHQENNRLRPINSEVMKLIGNADRLKQTTDWQVKTSLEKGILDTAEYIKSNLNKYKDNSYIL